MSLDTYANLQAEVVDWLARPDLAAKAPVFIQLAEAEMRRRLRRTRKRASANFAAASLTIPTDCAEITTARLATGTPAYDKPLKECTPDQLAEFRTIMSLTGRPLFFAVVGTEMLFVPAPNTTYAAELVYLTKLVPLSAINTTNTILTDAPDCYLYGSLIAAERYIEHDERLPEWKQAFSDVIDQLNLQRENEEFSAGIKDVRLPRVFG
jgi:hypothetical protein